MLSVSKFPLLSGGWKLKLGLMLLFVGLFSGWTWGAVQYGRQAERTEIALEKAAEKAKEIEDLAKEAINRKPVIEKATKRRVDLEHRLKEGMEKLNEATKEAGSNPACDLSDNELRAYEELISTQDK